MNKYFFRYNASYNHAWYDRDHEEKINLEKFISSLPYSLDRVIAISYNLSHRNRLYPKDMRSNFGEFNGCHQRYVLFKDCVFKDRVPMTLYLYNLIGKIGFFYINSFYGGYQFTFNSLIKKSSERETDVEKVREILKEALNYLKPYSFAAKDFIIFFDIDGLYDNYEVVSEQQVFQNGKLVVLLENILAIEYMTHKGESPSHDDCDTYAVRFFSKRINQNAFQSSSYENCVKINNIGLSNIEKEELATELFTDTKCKVYLRIEQAE